MTHIKSIINHPLLSIEPSFMFYPSPEPSPPKINNKIIRKIKHIHHSSTPGWKCLIYGALLMTKLSPSSRRGLATRNQTMRVDGRINVMLQFWLTALRLPLSPPCPTRSTMIKENTSSGRARKAAPSTSLRRERWGASQRQTGGTQEHLSTG